ncbi:MAG: thylakoid-associated protein, partial [Eubacterium sp.]|nr:thylakoid-associated protein [Eubacterium sp.]
MEKVALLKCTGYEVDCIEKKLREGFELLGGNTFLRELIPVNSKVLLKPNFLSVVEKGSPIITHYAVFEAVVRIVKEYTDNISFGDSPGQEDTGRAAEKSGMMEVAHKYGVRFADFNESVRCELENPLMYKYWNIAKAAYQADVVITLPKLKTHAMMYYTGAVKNQFGCIPGSEKAEWHTKLPDASNFGKMLLDLNSVVKTSFAILDGIIAMEGNGPRNGTPKQMNTLIMGKSLTAVDSTAVSLIGYNNVLSIPYLKVAHETGWGTVLPDEIQVLGEKVENMKSQDFKLSRNARVINFLTPGLTNLVSSLTAPDPVLVEDKCIGCRKCDEVCPERSKVISFVKRKGKTIPRWKYSNCIRCFCCQELCPKGAIVTRDKTLSRM